MYLVVDQIPAQVHCGRLVTWTYADSVGDVFVVVFVVVYKGVRQHNKTLTGSIFTGMKTILTDSEK